MFAAMICALNLRRPCAMGLCGKLQTLSKHQSFFTSLVHFHSSSSCWSSDVDIMLKPSQTIKHRITTPVNKIFLRKGESNETRKQGKKKQPQKHLIKTKHMQREAVNKAKVNGQLLYGKFPVFTSLETQRRNIYKLYIKSSFLEASSETSCDVIHNIIALARNRDIPIKSVSKEFLNLLVDDPVQGLRQHQGVCADVSPLHYVPLDLTNNRMSVEDQTYPPKVWLVIQGVQDPNNFGALLRSAYYLGVDKIIGYNSCKLSPAVSKVSAGVVEVLDIYKADNLTELLQICQSCQWQIFGTVGLSSTEKNLTPLNEVRVEKNTLVLLGNEGYGLSEDICSLCDKMIVIPPLNHQQANLAHGLLDSLNVSVASGIIIYHLMNNRVRL